MRQYLTVGELKQFLAYIADDTEVIISKDDIQLDMGKARADRALDLTEIYDGLTDAKAQSILQKR